LFFYPAAMTPGCTKEACHFRDLAQEFAAIGASRVGISTDGVDKQARFSDSQRFDYPLLSDADGRVAESFGVRRGLLGKFLPVKRTTFVIDKDRRVLEVISSEVNMDTHADKALEVLRARSSA
jgi:peroxiredoxin Q/BCP